jgi:hypothetical protein
VAGRGPQPKETRSRARDTPDRDAIQAAARAEGWDLPEGLLGNEKNGEPVEWHPATVLWWKSWRESPQAERMLTEPDWVFLLDTAMIHHQFWRNGRWEFAAELRLRAAKFGATPEDRARLKFTIEVPEQFRVGEDTPGGNVYDMSGRRRKYPKNQDEGADRQPGF